MKNVVIAIDGPSASGKSTVARGIAQRRNYIYVDSGSLYRGVAWKMLTEGIAIEDKDALVKLIEQDISIEFFAGEGSARFKIDGKELVQELRTEAVDESVSQVSAIPEVRKRIVEWLRGMIHFGSLVIEGRDIGTAVFPDADFKFYLDADSSERARRRHGERAGDDTGKSVGEVEKSLERRDAIDSTRKMDPLTIAPGAVVVDSTSMSAEEVISFIINKIDAD